MFHVGQRVVCVDASPSKWITPYKVVLGAVYTIRGFDTESDGTYLNEVPDDPIESPWTTPRGWNPKRFRPLVERKTAISIFESMLTPNKVKEPVE